MSSSGPSVVIMNDASIVDWQGAIHTWLTINKPGSNTVYFSFSNTNAPSLIGYDHIGMSSVADIIKRSPTEQHTIQISQRQYDQLVAESENFYKRQPAPNYDLTPEGAGDFNCVTAARDVLERANIFYLDGIQTPFGVKYKINGGRHESALEGVLRGKDDFDRDFIRYFVQFFTVGLNSRDIINAIHFDARRPITIPWGSKNDDFADFYLGYGGNHNKLHYAARYGNLELVKYLVENDRIDVSSKNANDNTPLHFAARHGHIQVVKYLVQQKNASPIALTKMKSTPLHYAALGGHFDVAEFLIDFTKQSNNNNLNIFDDIYASTPLHFAASSGNLRLVELLVRNGADVNIGCDTPLHYAVSAGGNLDIVKYLVGRGANMDKKSNDNTPTIFYVAIGGHLDIFQYLCDTLHMDWEITRNDMSTIQYAVKGGSLPLVEYLVKTKGANVNVIDIFNNTPLHDAASRGNYAMVKFLLRNGADANATNRKNQKAIDYARTARHSTIVACLESIPNCISQRDRRSVTTEYPNSFHTVPGHSRNDLIENRSVAAIIDANTFDEHTLMPIGENFGGNAALMDLLVRRYTGNKYEANHRLLTDYEKKDKQVQDAERRFQQAIANFKP